MLPAALCCSCCCCFVDVARIVSADAVVDVARIVSAYAVVERVAVVHTAAVRCFCLCCGRSRCCGCVRCCSRRRRSYCAYSSHCCVARLAALAFARCDVPLARFLVCSKWASNVVLFRRGRKRADLLKESTWCYVETQRRRCCMGRWGAQKMPHSRPILNTFEHFVSRFHPKASSRGPLPARRSMVSFWSLISCGLKLEAFPGGCIRAQFGFLKKKKKGEA